MDSVNCFVLDRDFAKELGKRENESDLEFYHRSFNGKDLAFICPAGFPEKPGPLLQALYLSNCALLFVEKIDAFLGEVILAIDALGIKQGFVAFGAGADEELFAKISEKTCVKGFERIEKSEALEKVSTVAPVKAEGKTVVDLDGMFAVKGVGTVALGFVTQGKVEQFQKLKLLPKNEEALVKSLQVHDKDVKAAEFNQRVGLSVKGADAGDFSRGMVLTNEESFRAANEFELSFEKNAFSKKEIEAGISLQLQCRLQTTGCIVKSLNPLRVETGKKIAAKEGEKIVLVDANAKPRILGKGTIVKI
ncbi:MAG: EF-Tu/IF-2/RF-3 family GTPase [Candidatus Diapherotrites archaeon]